MKRTATILATCLWGVTLALPAQADDATPATDWNETVLSVAEAEDGFMTLKGVRTVAMMHAAMHDALNAADPWYSAYRLDRSEPDADSITAAVQAAFAIATNQYPDQRPRFESLLNRWLQTRPARERQKSLALGNAAAEAVLAGRKGDGWDRGAEYRWHPMAPGVYAEFEEHSGTPQGFVFGAGWANARGFALPSADHFRVPPPPDIASTAYAEAFAEVEELGRFQSMSRTPDQTHIALWWKDFVENSHNRLARDLIHKENVSLHAAVRLLTLLNMGIFDAYVSSFNNKFHYNHWRPYTAIRWAAHDGNDATSADESWTNTHQHTYAFPSYPSAHGTACAAAMTALEDTLGTDYAFTMRIPQVDLAGPFSGKIRMHPPTRSFGDFSAAATQCGLSRIYLGIHFRYDSVEGVRLGEAVGQNVVTTLLKPLQRGE